VVVTYAVLAGVSALGVLLLAQALLGRRDHRYAGLPPGELPPEGAALAVQPARTERPDDVEVRLVPPTGVSPGEAGLLLRRRTSPVDSTATLLDLVRRGYVHLEETACDWTLTAARPPGDEVLPHEKALLATLFTNTRTVRLSTSERLLTEVATKVEAALARSAVERGWYRKVSVHRFPVGMVLFVLAFGFILGWPVLGIVAIALEAAGFGDVRMFGLLLLLTVPLVAALFLRRRKGRLPAGCAAHHQVRGFRRYLETAGPVEAERYLPWAVAFGLPVDGPARRLIGMG
jgi:predicted membrane protein DUF2207